MKNNEQEIKEFELYLVAEAQSLKKDPETYIKELGEDGLKEAYKRFQTYKLKKAQKAAHGAKLNFVKSLKHQCNDDEELFYFRRGGSIGCGCRKKRKEQGGIIDNSPINRFRVRKNNCGSKLRNK